MVEEIVTITWRYYATLKVHFELYYKALNKNVSNMENQRNCIKV